MFILKETENSDARCGSVITNFETMDEARRKMQELLNDPTWKTQIDN